MSGITKESDGSLTDDLSGLTLEQCENCGEWAFPEDDSYGLCADCIAAGHTPPHYF